MEQRVIYDGKAFVSFNSGTGHQDVELVDILLLELESGSYELRSPRQQPGHQVLITTLEGLTVQGIVLTQGPGLTRLKTR